MALASSFGGTVLGAFSEYASYRYAAHHGFRFPLEGVPYLQLAVTVTSTVTLIAAALVFILATATFKAVLSAIEEQLRNFHWTFDVLSNISGMEREQLLSTKDILLSKYRNLGTARALLISAVLGGILGVLLGAIDYYKFGTIHFALITFIGTVLTVTLIMMLAWNEQVGLWLSLCAMAIVIVGGPFVLMNVDVYGTCLRILGYGGGTELTVVLKEGATQTELAGNLLLRSNTSLFLYTPTANRTTEIPVANILRVFHQSRALIEIPHKLPQEE